jgi:hypothetical protein
MGICSSNCPTQEEFTFSRTHKTEAKKTPGTILRRPKGGKKENQQEEIEINKIFRNYRNKKQEMKIRK